jgi:hypothetical protein
VQTEKRKAEEMGDESMEVDTQKEGGDEGDRAAKQLKVDEE